MMYILLISVGQFGFLVDYHAIWDQPVSKCRILTKNDPFLPPQDRVWLSRLIEIVLISSRI